MKFKILIILTVLSVVYVNAQTPASIGVIASSQPPASLTSFITRVSADGGTFEQSSCMSSLLTSISIINTPASFVLTPNGYKTSKIYSYKPIDGSADFTFTRSTRGSRKNSTQLEWMGFNIPRMDYLSNTCPTLLIEPQRTNLLIRSGDITASVFSKNNTTAPSTGNSGIELAGADNLHIDGNYCYVASNFGNCVTVLDITDPSVPVYVAKVVHGQGGALLDGALGITKVGNYLYVTAINSNAVTVIDVTDPTNPSTAGTIVHGAGGASLTSPWNIWADGSYLYVTVNHALEILSISSPTAPAHVGTLTNGTSGATLNTPLAVKTSGNVAVVAAFGSNAIEIIDITTKSAPAHLASVTHGTGGAILNGAHGLWFESNIAYICSRTGNGISIFDLSTPSSPTLLATLADGAGGAELTGVTDIAKVGNRLNLVCFDGGAFEIVDVTTPSSPTHVAKMADDDNGALLYFADDIKVSGNYAYMTSFYGNGINVINLTSPTSPVQHGKISNLLSLTKILENTANAAHLVRQAVTKAASSLSYVASAVVKTGLGRDWVCFQVNDGTNVAGKFFNATTGALGSDRVVGSGFTIQDSKIIDLGSSTFKIIIRVTSTTGTTLNTDLLLSTDGSTISYTGDATKGIYAGAIDINQSSTPLVDSYIKTDLASVTRPADVISAKTSVTTLIGQTEGTIFFWTTTTWADGISKAISISDGTTSNRVLLDFTTGNVINATVTTGGISQATISNAGFSNLTAYKIAITYQNNKAALFVNGTKIGEDLSVTVPACSSIRFDSGAGSNPFYGNIQAYVISKTALSDADAQTLTTP